jgi:hypothetical protein
MFQGVFGNKIYNGARRWMEKMNEVTNMATSVLNSWTPTNHSNTMPRFSLADPNSNSNPYLDRWLEDGSYVRFKRLELGYSITNALTQKYKIDRIRLLIAGDNLFTISKYKGYNPDIGNGAAPLSRGLDNNVEPLSRTIMVGLNVDF